MIKKFELSKIDFGRSLIAPNGGAVLYLAESEEDPTGKSYYGCHSLFYNQLLGGKKRCKVAIEGNQVHDVKWNPDSSSFVVISGSQPAKILIFNQECTPVWEIDSSYKNYILFSRGGRFLMLGGYGNLAGDTEFWDLSLHTLVGNCKAHYTVAAEWAPNGKFMMAAVLNPRIRIDNEITFFASNGTKIGYESYKESELYEIKWIDQQTYPEKDIVVPPPVKKAEGPKLTYSWGAAEKKEPKMKPVTVLPTKAPKPVEAEAKPKAEESPKPEEKKKKQKPTVKLTRAAPEPPK